MFDDTNTMMLARSRQLLTTHSASTCVVAEQLRITCTFIIRRLSALCCAVLSL